MAARNSSKPGPQNRAVLYLRMSSKKQDKSIDAQRDELIALAKRKEYVVVREYVDSAISGDDTEKRTEFLRLRDDAAKGEFSIILVWDQDRLSRNDPLEIGYWLKPIRDAGVVLETPQGRVDWETFAGRMVYLIQQEGKHAYLRDLSRNVSRGMLAAARGKDRRGTGGRSPTGYKTKEDQVFVDPELAAIIRRIFEEYAKPGVGLRSVAELLNRERIKPPSAKHWGATTIRQILRNRKYLGAYVRFTHKCGKYHAILDGEIVSRKKSDAWTKVAPAVVVEENHEPIISQELFDRVQDKLAIMKKRTGHRTGHQYIFSGLVRCGDCNGHMSGYARSGGKVKPKTYFGYNCRTYHEKGPSACYCNSIGEVPLLDCVRRKVDEHYVSDQAIERLRETIKQAQTEADEPVSTVDQRQLGKRIEDLDKQIDTGAERVFSAPEALVPKLYAKLDQLRQQRDTLQRQLNAVGRTDKRSAAKQDREVEAALDALRTLRETLNASDSEDLRELLPEIVSKVELNYTHKQDGKRSKNKVTGGTIWLRLDPKLSLLCKTSGTHPRSDGRSLPRSPGQRLCGPGFE